MDAFSPRIPGMLAIAGAWKGAILELDNVQNPFITRSQGANLQVSQAHSTLIHSGENKWEVKHYKTVFGQGPNLYQK